MTRLKFFHVFWSFMFFLCFLYSYIIGMFILLNPNAFQFVPILWLGNIPSVCIEAQLDHKWTLFKVSENYIEL